MRGQKRKQLYFSCVLSTVFSSPPFFFSSLLLFRAAPEAYGASQAKSQIRATAAGVHHSHSNAGSETHLRSETPQLMALLEPRPTERGQGSNPHPHGYESDSFPLRHHEASSTIFQKAILDMRLGFVTYFPASSSIQNL